MFQRALWAVAGIDRQALETCPATDKVWATHLGFSLLLSFTVVLGISLHATSYIIEQPAVRFLVATVIALTVFMFDRALYQSDWFSQGFLRHGYVDAESDTGSPAGRAWWRFFRITVRLSISFGLAWMIALFLELAIFSDTITDKIKREHVTSNQPVFQKLNRYEAALDDEIALRRQTLATVEATYRNKLAEPIPEAAPPQTVADRYGPDLAALDKEERELRAAVRDINASIASYSEEMNAEQRGQKLRSTNSGRAGTGPRYEFARQQREVFIEQRAQREKELAQLQSRREELRAAERQLAAAASSHFTDQRANIERTRHDLEAQVETTRRELRELDSSRDAKLDTFRRQTLSSSEFKKLRDDPLARMTAYQELKSDPIDGTTITLFSWMTKLLVIFLEIVPVVAKIFFSPPSVYAARIQVNVARARARIRQESSEWTRQQQFVAEQPLQPSEVTEAPPAGVTEAGVASVVKPIAARRSTVTSSPAPAANPQAAPFLDGSNASGGLGRGVAEAPTNVSVKLTPATSQAGAARVPQPVPTLRAKQPRARPSASQMITSDRTARDAKESAANGQALPARSLEQELTRDLEQVIATARPRGAKIE
jgi:hypothetical protein